MPKITSQANSISVDLEPPDQRGVEEIAQHHVDEGHQHHQPQRITRWRFPRSSWTQRPRPVCGWYLPAHSFRVPPLSSAPRSGCANDGAGLMPGAAIRPADAPQLPALIAWAASMLSWPTPSTNLAQTGFIAVLPGGQLFGRQLTDRAARIEDRLARRVLRPRSRRRCADRDLVSGSFQAGCGAPLPGCPRNRR